jgi:hypothetical protein
VIIAVHPGGPGLRTGWMRLGAMRLPPDLAAADDQALRRVRARLLQQITAGTGKPPAQPSKPAITSTTIDDSGDSKRMSLPTRT